jgi:protein-tyrosine phosphatase
VKYSITFTIACAALITVVIGAESWPARVLLGSCAVTAGALAVVYASKRASYLGKRPQGRFAPWAYLVFWPYLVVNYLILGAFRLLSKESPYSEILPGLWVGCRLFPFDRASFSELQIHAMLDLTCEFSEIRFARRSIDYRCIPLLDTFAPSQEQFVHATDWIAAKVEQGPVYVHCAFGHGRSATVVAAYLLRIGHTATAEAALGLLKGSRPTVVLHPRQRSALSTYGQNLKKPPA